MNRLMTPTIALITLAVTAAAPAAAAPFRLVFSGTLRDVDALTPTAGGTDLLTDTTGFTYVATFDTSTPNLVAPIGIPAFVAYAPSSATIRIGGTTYTVDAAGQVAVSIFSRQQPFTPGLDGVGFITTPLNEGPGIIGDFSFATPEFGASALTSTVFSGYNGAGYNPGVGCNPGNPGPCVITPIALTGPGGTAFSLTLAGGESQGGPGAASITALPEPGTWALMIGGFGLVGTAARRSRQPHRA